MSSAQDILMGSRVAHIRELKAEIEKLKAENSRMRDELNSFRAHFDMAVMASNDLREGKNLEIWDGWNLILGAQKEARDKAELFKAAHERLQAFDDLRIWIVFDGKDENVRLDGGLRVSYTGGEGAQRADRFICDYVRMAKYLGLSEKVCVRTNDKDLRTQINRIMDRGVAHK